MPSRLEDVAARPRLHAEDGGRRLRAATKTPILTGLPFGHVPTKVTLPVGARVQLLVDGRDVLIGW